MKSMLMDGYHLGAKPSFITREALGTVLGTLMLLTQIGCGTVAQVKSESTLGIANKSSKRDSYPSSQPSSKVKKSGAFGAGYELLRFKQGGRNAKQGLILNLKLKDGNLNYRRGKPLFVVASLCNRTTNVVYASPTLVPQDYGLSFVVKDEKGKVVKFIGPKRRLIPKKPIPLQPGKCIHKSLDLNQLFRLPVSGRLTIQAFYHSNWLNKAASNVNLASIQLQVPVSTGQAQATTH